MNERPLIMKMRQDYRFFGGISILYGIVFAFCLYKNTHGVTFPLCVAVTILTAGLFMRRIRFRLQKRSLLYIIGMILLGISTALTTSFFLHFFNLLGIVLLFFVLMIHQFYDDHDWNFPMYLKRIFLLFGTMVGSLPLPFSHGAGYFSRSQSKKKQTVAAIAVGCFVALGILCLVLPLLLKSDLVFSRIFGEILKYINFSNLLGIGVTILFGFALGYGFFAALCKYNFPIEKRRKIRYFNPVVGITFTSIISVIYLMYCLIQIVYLFIGLQVGLPADLTYAEYARGGFWELLFVSIVNFIMVLLCLYLFKESLPLKIILTVISACTYIMILSAAYRMFLYVGVYHLTFLRILALWFLLTLSLIMAGVIVNIYRERFPLFRYIVAVVRVLYIGLSLARPDAIVAEYNIAHTENMKEEDVYYLLTRLSADAAPAIADMDLSGYEDYVRGDVYQYFCDIAEKNQGIYLRKANYSRIRAKLEAEQYVEEHRDYSYDWYE